MKLGDVEYVKVGETHVAYRVIDGESDLDHTIVMVNGQFFPMDSLFEDPLAARLVEGLASLGRLVMLDRRGIAMSDPISDWDTPLRMQWAEDVAAVVRTVSDGPVSVFSWEPLGTARTFAGMYPDLIERLVLWNPLGPFRRDDFEVLARVRERIRDVQRGEVEDDQRPERFRSDSAFRAWMDAAGRLGASPASAARITEHSSGQTALRQPPIDHAAVTAPTLVLARGPDGSSSDLNVLPLEFGTRAADAVPDGRAVVLDGDEWMMLGSSVDDALAEISDFVTGSPRVPPADRILTTLLFTDLVDSTARAQEMGDGDWKRLLDRHDAIARGAVGRCGGTIVKNTGDGFLATIPSVTSAIHAALSITDRLAGEMLDVRAGIHVGEVDRRGEDLSGIAVNVAARVMSHAKPGSVLMTHTAAAVTSERAQSIGVVQFKGVDGDWELFEVNPR